MEKFKIFNLNLCITEKVSLRFLETRKIRKNLDYFAGSGTTAHATIALNRVDDSGKRKYILVEQGEYFDTVIKATYSKVVYSADWKDGKPTNPESGISHCLKVMKLKVMKIRSIT